MLKNSFLDSSDILQIIAINNVKCTLAFPSKCPAPSASEVWGSSPWGGREEWGPQPWPCCWGIPSWRFPGCCRMGSVLASNLQQLRLPAQPLQIQRPLASSGTVPYGPWVFRMLYHFISWVSGTFLCFQSASWGVYGWWSFAYTGDIFLLSLTSWWLFFSVQEGGCPTAVCHHCFLGSSFRVWEAQPPSYIKVSNMLNKNAETG